MASVYPDALDSFANPGPTDSLDTPGVEHDVLHAHANDAIGAVQAELGVNPSGSAVSVAARLDGVDASLAGLGSDPRVFDAVSYGAVVDGVTDDTAAWQAAINACAAAGGGVVTSSKNGVSVIAGALQDTGGANAQLLLPAIDAVDSEQISITIRGCTQPPTVVSVIGATPVPDNHLVLKSTITSGTGALLGAKGPAGTFSNFTNVHLRIESIAFRMAPNPTNSCLNLTNVASVDLDAVVVDSGGYFVEGLTFPTTATSYGIKLPHNGNGAHVRLGQVDVIGFYAGYQFAEHATGVMVAAWGCKIPAEFIASDHASVFLRFMATHCVQGLTWTGAHAVDVWQYDIEHASSGPFMTTADVTDPSNFGSGLLRWWVVLANTGPDATFTKSGGSGLTTSRVGAALGSGGSSSSLTVQDENGNVSTAVTQLDFQGAGVTATAGTGEVVVTIPGGSGTPPVTVRDRLVANAGDTTLTLGAAPVTGSPLVWVNNVIKWPGTNYTASGSVITFTSALSAADVVLCAYQTTASSPAAATLSGAVLNIQDDFNRANSTTTLGTTSVGGKTWVSHSGIWGIATNRAYDAGASTATHVASVDAGVADCTVSAKLYPNGDGQSRYFGVAGRLDSTGGNGYFVQVDSVTNQINLLKLTGGTSSPIGASVAYILTAGDVVALVMSGSTLTVKVNGTTMLTRTDTTYSSNTRCGIWTYTDQGRFDDFSVQP